MTGITQITTIAVDSCVANVVQINGNYTSSPWLFKKVDNAIHWINHFPVEKALSFSNTYPVDSDLDCVIQHLMNWTS